MNWTLNNPMGWWHKLRQPKQPNEVSMKAKWKLLENGVYIGRVDYGTRQIFATARTLDGLYFNMKQNLRNNIGAPVAFSLDTNPSKSITVPETKLKSMLGSLLGRERARNKKIYGVESPEDEAKRLLGHVEKDVKAASAVHTGNEMFNIVDAPIVKDVEHAMDDKPMRVSDTKYISKIDGDVVIVYEVKEFARYPLASSKLF